MVSDRDETYIAGYEFGWNCGNCADISWWDLPGVITDGRHLDCPTCGATYEVSIQRADSESS